MLTPQEITSKEFGKAVFGGYDMAPVDSFIDTVVKDYTDLYKENAVLKNKMKVLVEKIEEYRATEDAMRMALLTAQKMAKEITDEAEKKSRTMIEDAERQVKERVGSIEELTATEERRLADAQRATKSFFEKARKVCNDQLKALDVMSGEVGLPAEEEAAPEEAVTVDVEQVDIDEAVRSIEQGVSRAAKPEPAMDLDLSDFDLSPAPKKKNLSSTQSFNL